VVQVDVRGLQVGRREHDALPGGRLEVRNVRGDPRLDPVGVALAQLLRPGAVLRLQLAGRVALDVPGELLELDPEQAGTFGGRDGSIVRGWPTTTVASAGRSPRSASFTARETPSSPGVRWTIAVLASRSSPSHLGGSESAKWICISERPYRNCRPRSATAGGASPSSRRP